MITVHENMSEWLNVARISLPHQYASDALNLVHIILGHEWPKRMLVICDNKDDAWQICFSFMHPLLGYPPQTAQIISETTPELIRRYILETPSIPVVISLEPVFVNDLTFPVVLTFARENELEYYKRFCTKDGILMDFGEDAFTTNWIEFQKERARSWANFYKLNKALDAKV